MAPKDYIKARKDAKASTNEAAAASTTTAIVIDGCPYLPSVFVDGANEDSIKHAVVSMLLPSRPASQTPMPMLKVTEITGGNTNILYRVSGIQVLCAAVTGDTNKAQTIGNEDDVLVRLFGAEGMINRDIENATYAALSRTGQAPKYYGRFGNGRIEGWCRYPVRALEVQELQQPNISAEIAKSMGRFHSQFVVPDDLTEYHNNANPSMWTQLHEWLDQALASKFQTPDDTQRAANLEVPSLRQELEWLQQDVVPSDAKVGFCHNDALAANILWDPNEQRIQLIDFEYGGVNYYSFDIANHFNEFAGGTDLSATPHYEWFPTRDAQSNFVTSYLQTLRGEAAVSDDDVQRLLSEVDGFILANHLYWGLWAINQAAIEGCGGFDYLKYGAARIEEYHKQKKVQQNKC